MNNEKWPPPNFKICNRKLNIKCDGPYAQLDVYPVFRLRCTNHRNCVYTYDTNTCAREIIYSISEKIKNKSISEKIINKPIVCRFSKANEAKTWKKYFKARFSINYFYLKNQLNEYFQTSKQKATYVSLNGRTKVWMGRPYYHSNIMTVISW